MRKSLRILLLSTLAVCALGLGAASTNADDDWDDRWEDRREEARERWEDYREEREDRRDDYRDALEDRYDRRHLRLRYRRPYTNYRSYDNSPYVYRDRGRYYDDRYYDRYDDGTVYYSAPRRYYRDSYYRPHSTYYGTRNYGYYETPYGREGVRVGPLQFEWRD